MFSQILLQAAPVAQQPDLFNSKTLLMWGMIIVVVFFFMIMPQRKKSKEAKKFRESLAPGSRVVTAGGIHGKIKDVKEGVVTLEIAEGIRIKIEKSSIYSTLTEEEGKL